MSVPASFIAPGVPDDYFAPAFKVVVEGWELDPETRGDVRDLKVTLDQKDLSSLELKLNNWDDTLFCLKWSDEELFALGSRIQVQLGYAQRLVSVFSGRITSLSPEFLSDGAPTLLVRATDNLILLKGALPPRAKVTWPPKTKDWEIAQEIAKRHDLRFEMTKGAEGKGLEQQKVSQGKDDDLVFLKERAKRIDHRLFIRTDAEGKDTLFFIERSDERGGPIKTYVLAWGALSEKAGAAAAGAATKPSAGFDPQQSVPPSMIEFKPTISAADQVEQVTVKGWDRDAKQEITYTAKPIDTPGVSGKGDATGPAAAKKVASNSGKENVIVNHAVATLEEAKALAEAKLAESAYRFLTGKGRAIGLPDLQPGNNLEIHGVGERFSGLYYVEQVVHSLSPSAGLLTDFTLSKTYDGKKKPEPEKKKA